MLLLFLYFSFVLNVSVGQSNKKIALEDQLARSISHISEILFDVEDKIGREREILSQIDNDLNELRAVEPVRADVDYGINIFWDGSSTQSDAQGTFGNYTYTIKTTPSLFPTPSPTSTYGTTPANWHLSSQADNLNIEDTSIIKETITKLSALEEDELIKTQSQYLAEISSITGVSVSTLKRIKKEGRMNNGIFSTPGKKRLHKPTVSNLDRFDINAIRNKIKLTD